MIEPVSIIQFIHSKKYTPMTAAELAEHFEVNDEEYRAFCKLLQDLEFQGEIVRIKRKQYANPKKVHLLVGTMDCNSRGFGFVVPAKKGEGKDIFVNEENMHSAMHGDTVVVRLPDLEQIPKRGKQKGGGSGQIVDVLKRANPFIVGTFKKSKRLLYVVPDNARLFRDVYVTEGDAKDATSGDKVVVKIVQWPSRHLNPEGEITEILGKEGDPKVDLHSIIYQFKLPQAFHKKVSNEAENISQEITQEEIQTRLDLRKKLIITIDPDDAKDFDDALSLEKDDRDNWQLGVHIADVSYYVKQDSAIDKEARLRGTSVYLPGKVIPMLPEALSNNLCSLREGEDRLTKSVLVTIDPEGNILKSTVKHSVINVTKRLTYKQATALIHNEPAENIPEMVTDVLVELAQLAQILFKNKMNRGAIELDLPEVSLKLDEEGNIENVEKEERDVSHRLVEECMLLANEMVATFMHKNKLPLISRVHPEPDEEDMLEFADFVRGLENARVDPFKIHQLQAFLEEIRGKPEAHMVNLVLLKSMKQAVYSATESGHFALALEHYAHFTSPIRRYPDLSIHRILDQHFSGELRSPVVQKIWENCLPEWAGHCSVTERRAEEAEREITKLKLLRFFETRVGDNFEGVITGVQEYGFFVQLSEYLLEGLVHIRTLEDDIYQISKKHMALVGTRRKKMFRIGDVVKVKIYKIDLLKREVDFIPYEDRNEKPRRGKTRNIPEDDPES